MSNYELKEQTYLTNIESCKKNLLILGCIIDNLEITEKLNEIYRSTSDWKTKAMIKTIAMENLGFSQEGGTIENVMARAGKVIDDLIEKVKSAIAWVVTKAKKLIAYLKTTWIASKLKDATDIVTVNIPSEAKLKAITPLLATLITMPDTSDNFSEMYGKIEELEEKINQNLVPDKIEAKKSEFLSILRYLDSFINVCDRAVWEFERQGKKLEKEISSNDLYTTSSEIKAKTRLKLFDKKALVLMHISDKCVVFLSDLTMRTGLAGSNTTLR